MNSNLMKVFSGNSNLKLSCNIVENLNIKLGDIYHHKFPSGESYCQYKENIRGADVFLIQGITNPANENLMELLVMADAARRASANRITAVIPYIGYSRQDRKDKSRVPISAKLIFDLFNASGIDRILTMDLHSPQICGFTNLPVDHITFEPILVNYIKNKYHSLALRDSVIIMAPDVGAVKRVEKYASYLKSDFGFISKKRLGDDKVELQNIVGDVRDKNVILIDDLTESCGTLIQAAKECKKQGAKYVTCAVTHGCITDVGFFRLLEDNNSNKYIDEFIVSNSVKISDKTMELVNVLDVSPLFAKAINCIHNDKSVSELFLL